MNKDAVTAEHFRQAEVNCLLEGLDSSKDAVYQAAKARIIAGEIDIDDAIRETVTYYKARHEVSVSQYAEVK